MISLAICSHKGGVGKTTIALNLAFTFARRGWKTLLVDIDPQGSIGLSISQNVADRPGFAQMLGEHADLAQLALQTRVPQFHLLPCGNQAIETFLEMGSRLEGGKPYRQLMDAARELHYDLVVFDTPAGFTTSTTGLLRHVEHALVPVQAEPLSVRSLPRFFELVGRLRSEDYPVSLAGILFSMYEESQQESVKILNEIASLLPKEIVLDTIIPRDAVVLRASAYGVPVALLSKRIPPFAMFFERVANELEGRIGLTQDDTGENVIPLMD